jgi:predicted metallopeptidase
MTEYSTDDPLDEIIEDELKSGKFPDAAEMRVKAVFAKGSAPAHKEAASCRKVPAILRLIGDYDFVLVFWTNQWNSYTVQQRHRLVVHELWHITANKNGDPKLRPHGGDFCEIPEHDKHSEQLAKEIPLPEQLAKGPLQVTLD